MARVLVNDESLTAIADAIREKLDVETTYLPSQMAGAIESIPTGSSLTSADEGKVVVESSGNYVLQAQTSRSISQNGTYDTTTNDNVVVSVSGGGGGFDPSDYDISPTAQWEQGAVSSNVGSTYAGSKTENATRVRFVAPVQITSGHSYYVVINDGYDAAMYLINSSDQITNSPSWGATDNGAAATSASIASLALVLRKSSNNSITPSEAANAGIAILDITQILEDYPL